jgi:hypothetical protein
MFVVLFVFTDKTTMSLRVEGVAGSILNHVVDYMKHHNGDEPVPNDKPFLQRQLDAVILDKWNYAYITSKSRPDTLAIVYGMSKYSDCHCMYIVVFRLTYIPLTRLLTHSGELYAYYKSSRAGKCGDRKLDRWQDEWRSARHTCGRKRWPA